MQRALHHARLAFFHRRCSHKALASLLLSCQLTPIRQRRGTLQTGCVALSSPSSLHVNMQWYDSLHQRIRPMRARQEHSLLPNLPALHSPGHDLIFVARYVIISVHTEILRWRGWQERENASSPCRAAGRCTRGMGRGCQTLSMPMKSRCPERRMGIHTSGIAANAPVHPHLGMYGEHLRRAGLCRVAYGIDLQTWQIYSCLTRKAHDPGCQT